MLSAVIQYQRSYPAMLLTETTGSPEVGSTRSSRTGVKLPQDSNADCG